MCSSNCWIATLLTVGGVVAYGGVFSPYMIIGHHVIENDDFSFNITYHGGFFETCSEYTDGENSRRECAHLINHADIPDWWKGCQALGCIGAVAVFIGWMCLVCWLCQKRKSKYTKIIIVSLIFTATVSYVGGLVLWFCEQLKHADSDQDFDWSFYVAWVGTIILLVSGVSLCYHRPEMQIRQGTGAGSEDIAEHHVLHPMQHPPTEVMAATRAQYVQPVPVPQPIPQPLPQHYQTQPNYPSYSIQPNQPSYPNQPNYTSQPNFSNPGYIPGYSVRH